MYLLGFISGLIIGALITWGIADAIQDRGRWAKMKDARLVTADDWFRRYSGDCSWDWANACGRVIAQALHKNRKEESNGTVHEEERRPQGHGRDSMD